MTENIGGPRQNETQTSAEKFEDRYDRNVEMLAEFDPLMAEVYLSACKSFSETPDIRAALIQLVNGGDIIRGGRIEHAILSPGVPMPRIDIGMQFDLKSPTAKRRVAKRMMLDEQAVLDDRNGSIARAAVLAHEVGHIIQGSSRYAKEFGELSSGPNLPVVSGQPLNPEYYGAYTKEDSERSADIAGAIILSQAGSFKGIIKTPLEVDDLRYWRDIADQRQLEAA